MHLRRLLMIFSHDKERTFYYVHWEGAGISNTWEPSVHLNSEDGKAAIQVFKDRDAQDEVRFACPYCFYFVLGNKVLLTRIFCDD